MKKKKLSKNNTSEMFNFGFPTKDATQFLS